MRGMQHVAWKGGRIERFAASGPTIPTDPPVVGWYATSARNALSLSKSDSTGVAGKITSWQTWKGGPALRAFQTFAPASRDPSSFGTGTSGAATITANLFDPTSTAKGYGYLVGHDDMTAVVTYSLIPTGAPLTSMVDGTYDAHWKRVGAAWHAAGRDQRMATGQPKGAIRIGWEGNANDGSSGPYFPWNYGPDATKAANVAVGLRRAVDKMVEGGLIRDGVAIDWCLLIPGGNRTSVLAGYPGDDYVDVVSADNYDLFAGAAGWSGYSSGTTGVILSQSTKIARFPGHFRYRWYGRASNGAVSSTQVTMEWLTQFAADHGKPMAIDEWGFADRRTRTVDDGGLDNPLFAQAQHDFVEASISGTPIINPTLGTITAPRCDWAWITYFDVNAGDGDYRVRPPGDDPTDSSYPFPNGYTTWRSLWAA